MIAHDGVEKTEAWLRGVKSQSRTQGRGRRPRRGSRHPRRHLRHRHRQRVLRRPRGNAEAGSEQRQWGDAIKVIRPTFAVENGTHVNISGAAVARHAPNRDNAVKLLEYLVSDEAQSLYAKASEYPVKAGVELDPVVASFGEMTVDALPLTEGGEASPAGQRTGRSRRLRQLIRA